MIMTTQIICINIILISNGYETYLSFWSGQILFYVFSDYFTGCESSGDVIFAVDASGSIGKENFKKLLDIVADITARLEIDKAGTSNQGFRYVCIGIYEYSSRPTKYGHKNPILFLILFLFIYRYFNDIFMIMLNKYIFRIGFLTYGNDAMLQFNLNEYDTKPEILGAFGVRYTGGTTNTAAALR